MLRNDCENQQVRPPWSLQGTTWCYISAKGKDESFYEILNSQERRRISLPTLNQVGKNISPGLTTGKVYQTNCVTETENEVHRLERRKQVEDSTMKANHLPGIGTRCRAISDLTCKLRLDKSESHDVRGNHRRSSESFSREITMSEHQNRARSKTSPSSVVHDKNTPRRNNQLASLTVQSCQSISSTETVSDPENAKLKNTDEEKLQKYIQEANDAYDEVSCKTDLFLRWLESLTSY